MKVAIILSGCGVFDGSEVNEVAMLALVLEQKACEYAFFAPDMLQFETIDHRDSKKVNEARNVLSESARIARGAVKDISALDVNQFDVLAFPGGFGVVKNFSSRSQKDQEDTVMNQITELIMSFCKMSKWILAICIAPTIISKVLNGKGIKLTTGNSDYNDIIKNTGNEHIACKADSIVVDDVHNIISTPAFMCSNSLHEVYRGLLQSVAELKDRVTR